MSAGPPGPAAALLPEGPVMPPVPPAPEEADAAGGVDGSGAEAGMVSGYRDKECFAVFGGASGATSGDAGRGSVGCASESPPQPVDARKNSQPAAVRFVTCNA